MMQVLTARRGPIALIALYVAVALFSLRREFLHGLTPMPGRTAPGKRFAF